MIASACTVARNAVAISRTNKPPRVAWRPAAMSDRALYIIATALMVTGICLPLGLYL